MITSETGMKAEKARNEDAGALVQLRLDYLAEDHGGLDEKDKALIRQRLPLFFQTHLNKDCICYIVREQDMIVSCAFLLVVEKPMSPAFISGKTGTVLNVYTRPEFRHRGCAKRIMERLIADAETMGLDSVELKATDAGYALYRSMGFADDKKYLPMKLTFR